MADFWANDPVANNDYWAKDPVASGGSPVTAGGLAKALGSGAVQGAAGLAGTPADLTALAAKGYDYLRGTHYADTIKPLTDALGSENIQKKIESYTGPLHQSGNRAEEIANTVGQFAPLALGGTGSIARRIGTQVLAPAAGLEAAKQATQGTDLEPYAGVAGAVIGGGIGSKVGRSIAATEHAIQNAPASAIKDASQNTYNSLTSRNVANPIPQSELDNLAGDIRTSLNNKGIRPSNANGLHQAITEIETPATKGAADVQDLVAARQSIKNFLGAPGADSAGASMIALPKIDAAIERLSPGTMGQLLTADKDWAAFKANQALDKRLAKADLQSAGVHSGMNVGNKIKQNVTTYLNSAEAKYLSKENRASLEKIVRGTAPQNAIRTASNLLGGGLGLGSVFLGGAGYESGHPELAAAPVIGFGLRGLSNKMVLRQAAKAAAEIRNRSPYGMKQLANKPLALESPMGQALLRAALAAQQPNGILASR